MQIKSTRLEWRNIMRRKMTIEEFIDLSNKCHGFKYIYSDSVYIDALTKLEILCPIHGKFWQAPNHHIRGIGCKLCGIEHNSLRRINLGANAFISKSNIIHNSKYSYEEFKYINAHTIGRIRCPVHGIFEQSPNNHLNGKGCQLCGIKRRSNGCRKSIYVFILDANKIHRNIYDYSKFIYVNSHTKGFIICPKHGKFLQSPNNHLNGKGCNKCRGCVSKKEMLFLDYVNILDTPLTRQVFISKKLVDGYDPATNTIYEFLGDYWHGNPKKYNPLEINKKVKRPYGELYIDTIKKLTHLKNNGYNIKYIWEDDWKKWIRNNKLGDIPIITY